MRAVQWDRYGGVEVLEVRDVDDPVPGPGQVRVRVRAAALNPGEPKIRNGEFAAMFPATFPSGEGTDLAGIVDALGEGVGAFAVGDEVLGWTDERASHAQLVAVPETQLTAKPAGLSWELAGSLFVAGTTALAAVEAVAPAPGETIAIAGAAGAVGSLAVQLVLMRGAKVIGIAGAANQQWLRDLGAAPVDYGAGDVSELLAGAAAGGAIDAFIDAVGGPYVDLALALGIPNERVDTIANIPAAIEKGVKRDGNAQGASAENLALLAAMVADGRLELKVARSYPLEDVRTAYEELETGHARGKIVLLPWSDDS